MAAFDSFVKNSDFGYEVTKTLVNKLIPVGKTRESIKKYSIIENDKVRLDKSYNVKKLIDRVHKKFISDVLSGIRLDWNELYDSYDNQKEIKNIKKLRSIQDKYRKLISEFFTGNETYKKLFVEELYTELLPSFCNGEELDDVNSFYGFYSYFVNFNALRKNLYISDEKHNTVAFRIINENFSVFYENCMILEKIKNTEGVLLNESLFREFEEICSERKFPLTDEAINSYNLFISGEFSDGKCIKKGLNQIINEYRMENKIKIPYFKQLYLNILSDRTPLFTVEYFNDTSDVLDAIKEFHEYFKVFYKELETLGIPEHFENFYVSDKKLNILSNLILKDFSLYKAIVKEYSSDSHCEYYNLRYLDELYCRYYEDNSLTPDKFYTTRINCTDSQYGNVGDLIIIKKNVYTPIEFEPLTDASTEESAAEKLKEIKGYKNIQDWMNTLVKGERE